MEEKKKRGGYRPNAGRKAGTRKRQLLVKISDAAAEKIEKVPNKSATIDNLILENL